MSANPRRVHLETGVLIIGAGAAGMSAAIAAHSADADVLLIDRSLIGRGGATVMAQMTVAAALGDEVPDDWRNHLADTLKAGRRLCDHRLAAILCEHAPAAIRQLDRWQIGWARHADGRMRQTEAPGHDRPRCVYVDFLNTGPAISRTLRTQLQRRAEIRRIGDVCMTDLVVSDGIACGAVGFSLSDGRTVSVSAQSIVIATGGLTRLYRRNSASLNMGGDGYALALRAGAELIDMEFVQFFPIGHLAPRLIGMDPIMWDPFRYKLGGQLLNAEGREFIGDYDCSEQGRYRATRDVATYAILKEVGAGRGSPAGGVYLSFRHLPAARLHEAFGPVIDRLAANGIDLTREAVEVAPIAHYHMGGIRVNASLETRVPRLFAAGEAVGGANGANRLSGNAIPEALVFGERAGHAAAGCGRGERAQAWSDKAARAPLALLESDAGAASTENPAALLNRLQMLMADHVGPIRNRRGLETARAEIAGMTQALGPAPAGKAGRFDSMRLDWFDLRNMLLIADAVISAALQREESRGSHQREDFPAVDETWTVNQVMRLQDTHLAVERVAAADAAEDAAQ